MALDEVPGVRWTSKETEGSFLVQPVKATLFNMVKVATVKDRSCRSVPVFRLCDLMKDGKKLQQHLDAVFYMATM